MALGTILAIASVATGFLGSLQEQEAAEDANRDFQKEATRQQREENLKAQGDKAERTLLAERRIASITAGFEALGGGAGQEGRATAEEAGAGGLDLARIEGNRRNAVASLQADKKRTARETEDRIKASQARFLSSSITTASSFFGDPQPTRNEAPKQPAPQDFGGLTVGSSRFG